MCYNLPVTSNIERYCMSIIELAQQDIDPSLWGEILPIACTRSLSGSK